MSLSDVDSVPARKILNMQMAVLSLSCYTQPLNNRILIVHDFFLIIPLSVTPIHILVTEVENKRYIAPRNYNYYFFFLSNIFFGCLKETPPGDVSFTHPKHILL